jgi:hypothetical protein
VILWVEVGVNFGKGTLRSWNMAKKILGNHLTWLIQAEMDRDFFTSVKFHASYSDLEIIPMCDERS